MFFIIIGGIIGAKWGVGYAVMGSLLGWFFSALTNTEASTTTSKDDHIPVLTGDDTNGIESGSFSSFSDDQGFIDDNGCDLMCSDIDASVINPANGQLMMGGVGGVDTEGNTYGFDQSCDDFMGGHNDDFCSDVFDDSFCTIDDFDSFNDCSFDDCSFDDNF
jgi:hypothetical protein